MGKDQQADTYGQQRVGGEATEGLGTDADFKGLWAQARPYRAGTVQFTPQGDKLTITDTAQSDCTMEIPVRDWFNVLNHYAPLVMQLAGSSSIAGSSSGGLPGR